MKAHFRDKVDNVFSHILLVITLILLTMLIGMVVGGACVIVFKLFLWWIRVMRIK